MVDCVLVKKWSVASTAERFQVDPKTVRKWRDRFEAEGPAGLEDRSSRPHTSPNRTPRARRRECIRLRTKRRWGADHIAHEVGLAASTVQNILNAEGLGRLDVGDRAEVEPVPGLVFCTAGKDRTGVLMALLLAAVGVTRTDVVADYTRSGPAGHAIRERFAARYHDRVVQVPPEMFEAPAPVIEAVLDEVDATFGSAAGYFDSHGVDAAALAALTAKLVG